MRSVILYCSALERDIRPLLRAVPGTLVYDGPLLRNGAEACMRGHKAIVAEAMSLDEPYVFVMEDDCQFTPHFTLPRWQADAEWAQAQGYDVLVGGTTRTYDERPVREGMIEVSAFHSAHCVVYFRSGYEKVLRATVPIDWTVGRDQGARCVVAWPFVAVQRPNFSGIERRAVNYTMLYQQHEDRLGTLVNA